MPPCGDKPCLRQAGPHLFQTVLVFHDNRPTRKPAASSPLLPRCAAGPSLRSGLTRMPAPLNFLFTRNQLHNSCATAILGMAKERRLSTSPATGDHMRGFWERSSTGPRDPTSQRDWLQRSRPLPSFCPGECSAVPAHLVSPRREDSELIFLGCLEQKRTGRRPTARREDPRLVPVHAHALGANRHVSMFASEGHEVD